jgi:phosphatidylglycerophosphate synthase
MARWWRLPDAPLRARVAAAAGGGAAAAAGLSWAIAASRDGSPAPVLTAVAVFTAIMTIVLGRIARTHPFPRFGPANRVTTARAVLVACLAGLLAQPAAVTAAWWIVVLATGAAVLDGLDGPLARRSGMRSAFGARFDMETDALLILVLAVLVWRLDKAGPWIVTAGLLRYMFLAAGWLMPWMRRPLTPTLRGRTVAVIQIVGLIVAAAPIVRPPLAPLAAGLTLAALVWSFAVDVRRLWDQR